MNVSVNLFSVWNLPWPVLQIPEYREVTLGSWTLKKIAKIQQFGYFQDWQGEGEMFALLDGEQTWMSNAWDEVDSQAPHVAAGHGHVVVMGAGMGMALFNLLAKPDVQRVTLVEREPLVLDLLEQAAHLSAWPGIEKLEIEITDAFAYRPTRVVDYLYVDIWADPGDPQALRHTQQIQKQVKAKIVGWWTQEIEFLRWSERKGHTLPITPEDYDQWADEIGLPMIEQADRAYLACISQVARSYCYRSVLQRLSQPVTSAISDQAEH